MDFGIVQNHINSPIYKRNHIRHNDIVVFDPFSCAISDLIT